MTIIITSVNLVQVGFGSSIFCFSVLRKKEDDSPLHSNIKFQVFIFCTELEPVTFLSVKKDSTVGVVEPNSADLAFLESKLFQAEEPQ